MNLIYYIISAIICHFIVETFIQSEYVRLNKSICGKEEDKKMRRSSVRSYAIVYGLIVSIGAMLFTSGITGICSNPLLFASATASGLVFYTLMYIASINLTAIIIKNSKVLLEKIYFEWFFNIVSILLYLVILDHIAQI